METLSITDVAKLVPKIGGRAVQPSTVWRWCRIGIKARNGRRVKLRHGRLGRRVVVPLGALEEFATALAEADEQYFETGERISDQPVSRTRTDAQRRRDIEKAEAETADIYQNKAARARCGDG